jgi:peptidoglycan LD-endopeptidase CwlK
MDPISEGRLATVIPLLAAKIRQMSDMLAEEGIAIRVTQALRSVSEQQALYEQGRTTPGKIVTNCPGGHSYHNVGLAVDCVPSVNGVDQSFEPDWNANHPAWKRMEVVGQSLGLESGATWRTFPDAPHFQIQGKFPVGAPNDEVRQLLANGGLQAVWDEVDKQVSS